MTEEQRVEFIKNKLAPLFDGMNARDAFEILQRTYDVMQGIFSRFNLSLNQQKT